MKVKEDVWTGGVREDNILYVLNNKLRERRTASRHAGIKYAGNIKIDGVMDDYVSFGLKTSSKTGKSGIRYARFTPPAKILRTRAGAANISANLCAARR